MGTQRNGTYNLLRKRFAKLRCQCAKLHEQQASLKATAAVLEELLKQRNALVNMYERLWPDAGSHSIDGGMPDDPSVAQLCQILPEWSLAQTIDQEVYDHVMSLTPAAAADIWIDRIKELALLLNMYERNPEQNLPALATAVRDNHRWNMAIHVFNPAVMYALQDYNLLTRRYDPAPSAHWAATAAKLQFNEGQWQRMKALMSFVKPRLQQIEQQRQKLLQELQELDATAHAQQISSESSLTQQEGFLQSASAADEVQRTRSESQVEQKARAHSKSSGSSGSVSGRIPTMADRTLLMQRREELMQQLAGNCLQWRVTTQMRGQWLTANCSPVQLARGMMAAFPYMPHGAPLLDSPTVLKGMAQSGRKPAPQQPQEEYDSAVQPGDADAGAGGQSLDEQ